MEIEHHGDRKPDLDHGGGEQQIVKENARPDGRVNREPRKQARHEKPQSLDGECEFHAQLRGSPGQGSAGRTAQ